MKIPSVRRATRALRRLWRVSAPNRVILVYHRVAEPASDPWELSVSPDHFAEHLEVLRRDGSCIKLQDLAQAMENRNLPRRAVVMTFDDGYADNLYNAKPLLEQHGIPATVFLGTGFLGQEREFWWDELERVLLQPGRLPATLDLTIGGSAHHWRLGDTDYADEAFRRYCAWKAWERPPTRRHALYGELWHLLQPVSAPEQRRVLDELASWAGLKPLTRPTHRALSIDEAATLGRSEVIEIGAHTVTHPVLPPLPSAVQADEIRQSKADCEAISGRPVIAFSYPFGWDAVETASLVRGAGFACACSTLNDIVGRNTDRFRLPRVHVLNWDGDEFAKRLARRFAW